MLDDNNVVLGEMPAEEDNKDSSDPISFKDEVGPYEEGDKEEEGDYSLSFMSGMDPYEENSLV